MDDGPGHAPRLSVLRVFRRSAGILVREFPVVGLVSIPVFAPFFWLCVTGLDGPPLEDGSLLLALIGFLLMTTQTYLAGILAPLARGQSPAAALPRSPKMVTVALVLAVLLGAASLFLPLWLLLIWYFFLTGPVAALERVTLRRAFGRSMEVAYPCRKKVALLIAGLFLVLVAAIAVAFAIGEWSAVVIFPALMIFAAIAQGVTYDELLPYSSSPEPSSSSSA